MIIISDEPQFPPLPAIGEILTRKDKFVERVQTVIKCGDCKKEVIRIFTPGDYTFKNLDDEQCETCKKKKTLTITEIFSEWYNPKKER